MQTVIGAFDSRSQAEQAVQRLAQMGIDRDDVHIEQKDEPGGVPQTKTSTTERGESSGEHRGFFARLFGMDDDAEDHQYREHVDTFGEAVQRGTSVVVVDAQNDEQAEQAAMCLHELGAIDVNERANQWRNDGWKGGTVRGQELGENLEATNEPQTLREGNLRDSQKLSVVQEELQVGKRTLDRGGVRVFQRVTEQPVREMVRLREERAVVDRVPVDRELQAGEMDSFKEGTVEIREMSEEPVVAKTARVVEEVRIGKEVKEREETIEDKVRRKDVEVERLAGNDSRMERDRAVARDDETLRLPKKNPDRPL